MTRQMIGLRLPPALLKAFDKWWKRAGFRTRTHAVEAALANRLLIDPRNMGVRYPEREEKSK